MSDYNGMELSAGFVQTPSGKDAWGHDIIFEFTGDDDFWFYVDNELVLDLGGIHSALAGNVNFCTGDVVAQTGNGTTSNTNLRDLFAENYRGRNPGATDTEVNNYLKDFFAVDHIEDDGTVVYEKMFKDYSVHKMRIFYMERGAGASNLHMRFNLSYVKPGDVMLTKETTGTNELDFDLVEYPYQIWYAEREGTEANPLGENDWKLLSNNDVHGNYENDKVTYDNSTQRVHFEASYTPHGGTTPFESVYFLHPGKHAEIHFPAVAVVYKVIECSVNKDVYEIVKINGEPKAGSLVGSTGRKTYESEAYNVRQSPTIVFQNTVDPNYLRTLRFQKKLYDEAGNELYYDLESGMSADRQDKTTFNYRLYLSNGADDNLNLTNMYKYYVKNAEGYYCRWDVSNQCFAATNITDVSSLSEEVLDTITFETSMNGAISKIPARYTVEVPYLPVGMKFRVEEGENEIPLGYSLVDYVCENNSYEVDGTDNSTGWIKEQDTPDMTVSNKRGFGLEANKTWSDSDFTKSHAAIYTAVFIDDALTPVPNTIKKIDDPNTYVRYFFDSLETGKNISDYSIQEVELTGDIVTDSNGLVTSYGTVKRIIDGNPTVIEATPTRTNVPENLSYVVRYEQGTSSTTASGAASDGNIRSDKIENRRSGGLVISLYDMQTRKPLAGGEFVLKRKDIERTEDDEGNVISTTTTTTTLGRFTSNSFGRITVLYDFLSNATSDPDATVEEYTLTQIGAPQSYIAVPNTTTFFLFRDDPNNIRSVDAAVYGNETMWEDGYKSSVLGDELVAYIDVFNKQFSLKAKKTDSVTNLPVSGAKFALYRSVKGVGGELKDIKPAVGYEELVSDTNGVIPKIDRTLPEGKYYLTEKEPPSGYDALDKDIVFTVSADGSVTINSAEHEGYLTADTSGNINTYTISIPNTRTPSDSNELKLSHKINADDVNSGLKLETLGVANRDVFEVQMGTKNMGAGSDNNVTIPITHDFARRSPNYTYIEGEIYYPQHLQYAAHILTFYIIIYIIINMNNYIRSYTNEDNNVYQSKRRCCQNNLHIQYSRRKSYAGKKGSYGRPRPTGFPYNFLRYGKGLYGYEYMRTARRQRPARMCIHGRQPQYG